MKQHMKDKIVIPTRQGMVFLKLIDIIYFEEMSNNTLVYTRFNETHLANKTLEEYEAMLIRYNFLSINNSCLINMDHINTYPQSEGSPVVMFNDDVLLVSEEIRSVFEKMF